MVGHSERADQPRPGLKSGSRASQEGFPSCASNIPASMSVPVTTWASSLTWKPIVVSSGRQQIEQPATARGIARHVPALHVESGSPRGVQTPKKRPVESTGVQIALC